MSTVQKITITNKEGVTLATEKKYCPRNINVVPKLNPLEVSADGTYPVPDGYAGHGEVTVKVGAKTEAVLEVTQNGTYTAPAGVVYTSVVVNVPTASAGSGNEESGGGEESGGESGGGNEGSGGESGGESGGNEGGGTEGSGTEGGGDTHVHSYTTVVTAPTCTEGGYTTYTCVNCGDSYQDDETDPTGHNFSAGYVIDKAATCAQDGSKHRTCQTCGYIETYPIPAVGHTEGEPQLTDGTPTCTVAAHYKVYCTECGELLSEYDDDGYFAEHIADGGRVTTAATCTADGVISYYCRECDTLVKTEAIPATGHHYTAVVTEATCTEGGYTTYTCVNCGDSYQDDETDPTGHNFSAGYVIDKAATCAQDGSKHRTCQTCGYVETYPIPATGNHSYEADHTVDAADCETEGYIVYKCSVCGDTYTDDYFYGSHDYEETDRTDATCTEDGSITYTCTVCGDSYTEDIPATGHSYEWSYVGPTCDSDGYTTYTCSGCGDSYDESDEGSATGHNYESETVEPDCESGGYTTYTCVNCGDSYTADYTEALGHDWEYDYDDSFSSGISATCTRCGLVEEG